MSISLWESTGITRFFTSSGLTYSDPLRKAFAREACKRCSMALGLAPREKLLPVRVASVICCTYERIPSLTYTLFTASLKADSPEMSRTAAGLSLCTPSIWFLASLSSSSDEGYPMESRIINRSSCASGRGYVPVKLTGFWVAMTMKGSGSGYIFPSTVTCVSAMASSRAACVLGDVRFSSSASIIFFIIDPGLYENSPVFIS